MAMTYSSLTASKGNSGAVATWVNYTLLDVGTIVDEAQALLYGLLRCREMMTSTAFAMAANSAYTALPSGFLEPIGRIEVTSFNSFVRHKDASFVAGLRNYTENSGTLGANPFTTADGSTSVAVALANHGFTQDSIFNTSGAAAFNGVTIAGTFPVTSIVDANDFTIDITSLGTVPNAAGSGGGSSVAYICDSLTLGTPVYYGIWDELLRFDSAFFQTSLCWLHYYQSLPLLSSSNQSNFLTARYPHLMRRASLASAADFMKDDDEHEKQYGALVTLIQQVSAENDMQYRSLELDPDIP